jgi:signal transduction histidine kinase
MVVGLAEIAGGLPMAASFAFAGGIASVREGRRRAALNAALHELRRPLQALALSGSPAGEAFESSLRLASSALERLEREVNGEPLDPVFELVSARSLAEAAVARWQGSAADADASLRLHWMGGEAAVWGSPVDLAQALDNVITNGIEHGGGDVLVAGSEREGMVRLAIRDSGTRRGPGRSPLRRARRLSGRSRRGHGLRLVRHAAAAHGGRFRLRRTEGGSEAVLELPAAVGR